MSTRSTRPSYWAYLRTDALLALQGGLDGDETGLSNDEVLFIVIHQIDELWFKLVLRELEATRDLFARVHVPEAELASAAAHLRRITKIFGLATHHFELLETMRTQDYLAFRDKLSPASGFQSAQMREMEILMGLSDEERLTISKDGSYLAALRSADGSSSKSLQQVERRRQAGPSLKTVVERWLVRTPILGSTPDDEGDAAVVDGFVQEFLSSHAQLLDRALTQAIDAQARTEPDRQRLRERYAAHFENTRDHLEATGAAATQRAETKRLRAAILFIDCNRRLPLLSWPGEIIDALIEFEQAMIIFRQRHARMVERVIGQRVGTGGSDGVAYLDETALRYRVFKEIWAAKTLLLPPDLTPQIVDPQYFGLTNE